MFRLFHELRHSALFVVKKKCVTQYNIVVFLCLYIERPAIDLILKTFSFLFQMQFSQQQHFKGMIATTNGHHY